MAGRWRAYGQAKPPTVVHRPAAYYGPAMTTVASGTGVGPLLRGWRERRRLSQLEPALRAGSSARHISFVETGRSRPSETWSCASRSISTFRCANAMPFS